MKTQKAAVETLVHYIALALSEAGKAPTPDMRAELDDAIEAFGPPSRPRLRMVAIVAMTKAIDASAEGIARECEVAAVAALRALPFGTFADERS